MTFDISTAYGGPFSHLLAQHLTMAIASVLIGLAVSLPVGLCCARWTRFYPPVLGIASLLYAIPSLAFFVLLIDSTGLTETTVIIPLAIYTLALLIPNVVDGLRSVPDEVRKSAVAMGFGPVRTLLTVELPLAMPAVIAGVRVAMVSSISLVSISDLVGVNSLSNFFTYGEQQNRQDFIVTGIVATVVMALVFDGLLVLLQRVLTPWASKGRGAAARRDAVPTPATASGAEVSA
jgi:osmoprotectant transport system permease protein